MRGLVLITVLCMGLLLIGLTTWLMLQRQGDAPPEVVLLQVSRPRSFTIELVVVLRRGEHELWHPIGPTADIIEYRSTSPDGQWLYLRASRRGRTDFHMSFVRLKPDGLRVETLPPSIQSSTWTWSHDGQWLLFSGLDVTTGHPSIFRAKPDGKQVQNLTPQFDATVNPTSPATPVIIADKAWVVLGGFGPDHVIHRLDMPSGQISQITTGPTPSYLRGHIRNASGDWLLVTRADGEYRMRLDGSELTPLLPQESNISSSIIFWPTARLILMEFYDSTSTLYAVSMDDFSVRWSLPNIFVPNVPHTGTRILGYGTSGWVYTITPDGVSSPIVELFTNGPAYEISPDERWVVVAMGGNLWMVNLVDGRRQGLYNTAGHLSILKWAEDGQSLYIEEDFGTGRGIWRVWIADGRRERLLAYQERGWYVGIGRLAKRTLRPLPLLAVSGLLVMGGVVGMKRGEKSKS